MHCGPIHLRMSPERLFDTTFIMRSLCITIRYNGLEYTMVFQKTFLF